MNNPWLITKVVGPWALLFSLALVVYKYTFDNFAVKLLIQEPTTLSEFITIGVMYLGVCIFNLLFLASVFSLFRRMQNAEEQKLIRDALNNNEEVSVEVVTKINTTRIKEFLSLSFRILPYSIWIYILFCPYLPLTEYLTDLFNSLPSITAKCFFCVALIMISIVICLLISVLCYPFYHSLMLLNSSIKFKKALAYGFRYKFRILWLMLVSVFITILLSAIAIIPVVITENAYLSYVEEKVNFNTLPEMPSAAYFVMLIVAVLSISFISIMSILPYSTLMYAFGDLHFKSMPKVNNQE